jgi:hypothetical protein
MTKVLMNSGISPGSSAAEMSFFSEIFLYVAVTPESTQ